VCVVCFVFKTAMRVYYTGVENLTGGI